jgi:oligoendopeptidase F
MQVAMSTSSADHVKWDLSDLYSGADDPALTRDSLDASKLAQQFESRYRGRIAAGPTADLLLSALQELEALYELMDKPAIFASLLHAAKTDDPRNGALLSRTREERTAINKHLIFFDLEWVQLADELAKRLMADPALSRYRHYLQQKRAWRPHYLSEPEEKILEEKGVTGRAAFVRLFDETVAGIEFPYTFDSKTEALTLQQVNSRLHDTNREVRQAAANALTSGLQANAKVLSFIFNNLVLDHKADCALRSFPDPMASRHLANEISAETVNALMTAAERHHDLVQRYYRLKTKLLGLDTLYDYDRYAPIFTEQPKFSWSRARQTVTESYTAFSPRAGQIVNEFFEGCWIDAELRPGKRGGAFSSSAVPSAHPYILMSYTDQLRDVMTLAHELGHGVHQYLSRPNGYLQCDTPLTTAETASVFGEMLTFEQLLKLYPDPRTRLALLCGKLEDAFATVFRQVVLTRFEQSLHRARSERGELAVPDINQLWLEANRPMHGDVVTLTDGYAWWWLYIGHFIHSPFYCYAYAFGELLVLALFQKYKQEGERFVPAYLDLLAAGGTEAPPVLLAKLGVNINDPNFWELGLALLGKMVDEAEDLARSL